MRIALANDQGALEARAVVLDELSKIGVEVVDCGTEQTMGIDYPDMAEAACRAVVEGRAEHAVLMCGTGIGISIAANKIKGIRCALCMDEYAARMAREHNDANALALRGREFDQDRNRAILRVWLETPFSGVDRHQRRIDKIGELEK